jgi:predicted protein tyrosine phosphatase
MNKNRMHNLANPYQGEAKKVLCVCSAGLLRSPTAASVLHNEFGYNTRAAGTSKEYALIHADEALLTWAEEIVCMDMDNYKYCKDKLDEYGLQVGVVLLSIDDDYAYMDSALKDAIFTNYVGQ